MYIAVALVLIVGGLVFYQQAVLSSRVQAQIRVLTSLVAETRVLVSNNPNAPLTTDDNSMWLREDYFISAGAVLPDIVDTSVSPAQLRTSWGTTLIAGAAWAGNNISSSIDMPNAPHMVFRLDDIPSAACARLVAVDAQRNGVIGTRIIMVRINDNAARPPGTVGPIHYSWTDPTAMTMVPIDRLFPASFSEVAAACRAIDYDRDGLVTMLFYLYV
jgi:hypothetical protein